MKRLFLVFFAVFLAFTWLPNSINNKYPKSAQATKLNNLTIEVSPSVLTAGVIPEKLDANLPLTLKVKDDRGLPVDFTKVGVRGEVNQNSIWANCFLDPHKDNKEFYGSFEGKLPQNYWTRTDLHNDDFTKFNNSQFEKQLANFDMSESAKGIYKFFGFCANDAGDFVIVVRSLDGSRQGIANIKVELPKVEYEIANIENPNDVFNVPGKPDFVMTAFNKNVYKVTATVRSADGKPIKGDTSGNLSAQTIDDTARITPFCTKPHNYSWAEKPGTFEKENIFGPGSANYLTKTGGRNDLQLWCDFDRNGEIGDNEKKDFGPQNLTDPKTGKVMDNPVYYVSSNTKTETAYDIAPMFDFPNAKTKGWGLGSIYNQSKHDGMIFADINEDKKIDYRDSIKLDDKGKASFYVTADDVCEIGVMVACNNYGEMDVAGRSPKTENSPSKPETRYFGDGTYFLDFDAVADTTIKIYPPVIKVFDGDKNEELQKELMNKDAYDCVYGIENKLIIRFWPASSFEKARIKENIGVRLEGQLDNATSQDFKKTIYTQTTESFAEVVINFNPVGVSYNAVNLVMHQPININNKSIHQPIQMKDLIIFDTVRGIFISKIDWDVKPQARKKTNLTVKCVEVASHAYMKDATISLSGCGVNEEKTTDVKGNAIFFITPSTHGFIKVSCKVIGYSGKSNIFKVSEAEKTNESIQIMMVIGSKDAIYNGSPIKLDVAPYINNGTTLVPLRVITDIFGAKLDWDAKEKKITITRDGKVIVCWIGKKQAFIDGKEITLNAAPEIKEGKTTVPLRFFSEAFGCEVHWDAKSKMITISN
jgi:hypothetical protein